MKLRAHTHTHIHTKYKECELAIWLVIIFYDLSASQFTIYLKFILTATPSEKHIKHSDATAFYQQQLYINTTRWMKWKLKFVILLSAFCEQVH